MALKNDSVSGFMTNLQDYVESEWLKREFGLEFEFVNPSNLDSKINVRAIFTEDLRKWEKVLLSAPPSSVVVFLSGNEYYESAKFEQLDFFDSISAAFVQYLPNTKPRVPFKLILNTIIHDYRMLKDIDFWRTLKRALIVFNKIKKLNLKKKTYSLPLGYTTRFVRELKQMNLVGDNESILGKTNWLIAQEEKLNSVCFVGQKGSWVRRKIVESFKDTPKANLEVYDGWGGGKNSQSVEYSISLLRHKYCLCPPGNLSNDTPRYYESICLGSLPLLSRVSIQDWNDYGQWPKISTEVNSEDTPLEIYRQLNGLSDSGFRLLMENIQEYEKEKISQLRETIWQTLNQIQS